MSTAAPLAALATALDAMAGNVTKVLTVFVGRFNPLPSALEALMHLAIVPGLLQPQFSR
jgi:hypothetical protein